MRWFLRKVFPVVVDEFIKRVIGGISVLIGRRTRVQRVWGALERHDSRNFPVYFERMALRAHRVRVIGTGLALLMQDDFRRRLMDRAASGECQLRSTWPIRSLRPSRCGSSKKS